MRPSSRSSDASRGGRHLAGGVVGLVLSTVLTVGCGSGHLPANMPDSEYARTYTITLPRKDNSGQYVSRSVYESLAKEMSGRFGGVSVYTATYGCWEDDNSKIVCEENIIFSSSRICGDEECKEGEGDEQAIDSLARKYGKLLGQSAVYATESPQEAKLVEGQHSDKAAPQAVTDKEEKFPLDE